MLEVEYLNHSGDDLFIVNSARVSMDKSHERFDDEKDFRLLKYLAKHRHWTPFGQVSLSVRVTCPIFVSRQLEKHIAGLVMGTAIPVRNEISRRYVDSQPTFYIPDEWRSRAENVKQGSGEPLDEYFTELADSIYDSALVEMKSAYQKLLDIGVAPEQARMILPQSMITQWIWTGSLAAYHRIYKLRTDSHAQKESRIIAEKIGAICQTCFPYAWTALTDHG